ncbi:MAG: RsbRD N-terminal domain-containing protein [Desulfobacterales bacterium]
MGLEKVLAKKRNAIVGEWFDLVAKTYAPDTAQFLKRNKDPFSNPVGGYLTKGLSGLFDQLLTGMNREAVRPLLDPIVRVRAVQNFTPAQATAFVLVLKNIVRTHVKKDLKEGRLLEDLFDFEARVDALSLFAFDIYMECREKIYQLKANEEKDKIYKAFKRAGLIEEEPENKPAT